MFTRTSLAGLVAAALIAVGCGAEETTTSPAGSQEPPQASGIQPASPGAATRCLEGEGFMVERTGSAGPDVAELVTLTGGGGGGTINYYVREADAFDAEVAALAAQEPHALVGRVGSALYAFESEEGLQAAGRRIEGCL